MAIQRDYLTVNPASKVTLPNPENERDRILSEDEWSRLYTEAGDTLQPILLMAYRLGLRFGEIVNLTWDRVDRERGLITCGRSIPRPSSRASASDGGLAGHTQGVV